MKNKMFSGWKDVFLFTLKQGFVQKYAVITVTLAIIFLVGGLGINIFLASDQKKDDNVSPVEKVFVIDNSDIGGINWIDSKQIDKEQFPNVIFEPTDLDVKELGIKLKNDETTNVITKITKEKDSFEINVFIPYGSEVTKADGENLAKAIKNIVNEGLINESKIDEDKIEYVVSSMNTEFSTVGENAKSDNMLLLTTVFPIIFMFVLYFMVIIYGQNMGQIVSIEKSSKLMESLLVMTRPYGLIFGKIIATSFIAIFQIVVWFAAGIGGFVFGEKFAQNMIYADYENGILAILREIISDESVKAFTGTAIVLTIIAICLAFLFYCMLAGAISSFASKADELGTVMMFYNMFIVIGFMGSYIIPSAVGQEWIKVVIKLIPMSAAFLLPGEILLGTTSAGMGAIYLLVLLVWIVVTAIIAGKIYKDQLFYNGKSLKERLPWMKNKKEEEGEEQWVLLHDEAGRPLEKSQKIGYFFLAISPLAIFMVIEVAGSLVLTNIMTRIGLRGIDLSVWETKDFVEYYRGIESTLNPLTMVVCHLLIITTFGLWMYFVRRGIDKDNILHIKTLLDRKIGVITGVCVICGLALCVFANGTVMIESELIPSIVENYAEMAQSTGMGVSPFAIFAAVCLAPIGEELLCRGICLYFGKKALGKFWYANIIQAILFGVLHMNWVQGIYAFIIGLVLGVLVERYESLLPAMFVHFIVNFSSSTWTKYVFANVEMTLVAGVIMVAVTGIITMAVLYFSREKCI